MDLGSESDAESERLLMEPQQRDVKIKGATNHGGTYAAGTSTSRLEQVNERQQRLKAAEKLNPESQAKTKTREFVGRIASRPHEESHGAFKKVFDWPRACGPKFCKSKISETTECDPSESMVEDELITFYADNFDEPCSWRPVVSENANLAQTTEKSCNPYEQKSTKQNACNTREIESSMAASNNNDESDVIEQNLSEFHQFVAGYLAKVDQRSQEKSVQTNLQRIAKELESIQSMISVHLPQDNKQTIAAAHSKQRSLTYEQEQIVQGQVSHAVDTCNYEYETPPAPSKSKGYAPLDEDDTSEEEAPLLEADWNTSSKDSSTDMSDFEAASQAFHSADIDLIQF